MNVCHSQGCSVRRNHFEKNESVLKMNLTLGDQELLSIQTTFWKLVNLFGHRRITVLELSQEVGISVGSVEEILHKELKVSKVSARWVPRLLTREHRQRRLVVVTQLFQRYEREGAELLDSIVTCDENWVHYLTPESKRANKQCKHTHSPPPQKKRKQFFQRGRSWLLCSGIPRVSFTWTLSLVKEPSIHSTIQLS
jgi:hypothetical protein